MVASTVYFKGVSMSDCGEDSVLRKTLIRIGKIHTLTSYGQGILVEFDDPLAAEVAIMLQLDPILHKKIEILKWEDEAEKTHAEYPITHEHHDHLHTPIASPMVSPTADNKDRKKALQEKAAFGREQSAERYVQQRREKYKVKGTIPPDELGKFYQEREKYRSEMDFVLQKLVNLSFSPELSKNAVTATGGDLDSAIDWCCAHNLTLATGWSISHDRLGRVYYTESSTGHTTYTAPVSDSTVSLPANWVKEVDRKGRTMFRNVSTKQVSYVLPSQV